MGAGTYLDPPLIKPRPRSARVSEGLCVQTMPSLLESKNPKVSLCSTYPLDMFLVTALFYLHCIPEYRDFSTAEIGFFA